MKIPLIARKNKFYFINVGNYKRKDHLVTGTYKAQAVAGGYDASTLDPKSVNIIDGTTTYAFTISATGTLTLHVTDTGNPDTVKSIVMTQSSETVQITNPPAPVRNFTLMDASFSNISIIDGQIILEENQ